MPTVYLSPSTQEANRCAAGDTEEQHMNRICDVTEALLKQQPGFTVYRNRPEMTLAQVIYDSNSRAVDAHVALHSNAGGNGRGTEVFCWPTDDKSRRLAQCLYDTIAPLTPNPDRGVKDGAHLMEINSTRAVAALIEIAFHDDPEEAKWIHSHEREIGEKLAEAVCLYFGVKLEVPQVQEVVLTVPGIVYKGKTYILREV